MKAPTSIALSVAGFAAVLFATLAAQGADGGAGGWEFRGDGPTFTFRTALVTGSLGDPGKSLGLKPVLDAESGKPLAGAYGWLSHYRLLDAQTRYGTAAWDWPSTARRLPDGAVEIRWSADAAHPFDLEAVYRGKGPGTIDVTTRISPKRSLGRMEVFLASYLQGFPRSAVYVEGCKETGGKPGFLEATKDRGVWQMFPRDDEAWRIAADGRWKRPPNPVEWARMPRLAGPLALRSDAAARLGVAVMAPPADCFAVATPYGEESHGSLYFSLFGRDMKPGESCVARTRLVIQRGLTEEQAVELYRQYLKEIGGK